MNIPTQAMIDNLKANDKKELFSTREKGLAAYIVMMGYEPIVSDIPNSYSKLFSFEGKKETLEEMAEAYKGYELKVDCRTYFEALRKLNTQVFKDKK